MKSFFILVLSVLFLFGTYAEGEELTLDLNRAVETALIRNPALQQMKKDADIAVWNRRSVFSTYLPHAFAEFSAEKYYEHSGLYYDENYSLDLILRQSLIDVSRIADIRAAYSMESAQKQNLLGFEQKVIFDVIRLFYRAVLDEEKLATRAKALSLAEEELEVAKKRYDEGIISYYDLLRSETKKLTASAEKRMAESEHRKSLNNFKEQLGYDPAKEIALEGELKVDESFIGEERYLDRSSYDNPRLAAAKYHIERESRNVQSARSAFLPSLGLEVFYRTAKHQQFTVDEWDDHWAAFLKVSFPLFEGSRRYSALKTSHAELARSKERKKEITNEIKKDMESFYQDHIAAKELLKSQRKNLAMSRELYDLVRERYQVGESSEIELMDAHLNLIDVENTFKEAKYQTIVSYYGMLFSAGRLDKEGWNEN